MNTITHRPRVLLAAAVVVLAVAGTACGPGDDTSAPATTTAAPSKTAQQDGGAAAVPEGSVDQAPADGKPLAQVEGESNELTLRVTGARRGQGGKWITVRGTITNNSSSHFYGTSQWQGDYRDMPKSRQSVAGATLVDEASMKRYYVLRDTTGLCLCTTDIPRVDAGKAVTFTASFPAPPPSSTELGFQLPTFPLATIKLGG
ncbi:hypothetical protein ACFU5O_36860 [Streptomyces sp. NPDC057445]|uniref:hypothetical protein n=1 Tax=Streptomyces sp. NPDC057445 TaxID=3346136 RepID=UPI0036C01AD6